MKRFLLMGILLSCSIANATDYKTAVDGKVLRMDGGTCAGISLTKQSGLMGEQPLSHCSLDLPARVKWLSDDTFMMVESEKSNDTSPPRVFVSKIKSVKGNKVVIKDIWTGWGNQKDEEITYTIVK